MANRNGLQRMIYFTKQFCRVYNVFSASAFNYIDSLTGFTDAQKDAAKAALTAVTVACHALDEFYKVYES